MRGRGFGLLLEGEGTHIEEQHDDRHEDRRAARQAAVAAQARRRAKEAERDKRLDAAALTLIVTLKERDAHARGVEGDRRPMLLLAVGARLACLEAAEGQSSDVAEPLTGATGVGLVPPPLTRRVSAFARFGSTWVYFAGDGRRRIQSG